MKTKNCIVKGFTLLELLVSMVVFTILMMTLMQFVNSAQKLWVGTDQKNAMFENARIALDFISRDVECIFYEADKVPFLWSTSRLAFVTVSDIPPTNSTSRLVGTQYYIDTSTLKLYAWRKGNTDPGWANFYVASIGNNGASYAATAFPTPSATDGFSKEMIPYVIGLTFNCINKQFAVAGANETPFAVSISLTLIDKNTYLKWNVVDATHTLSGSAYDNIVVPNMRTFSRMIFIGDRGQQGSKPKEKSTGMN